jgi:hypothetical protein
VLLPAIPPSVATCERPLTLPEGAITRAQVEQLWARDRGNLIKCGMNLETLIDFYEGLSADFKGADRGGL